MNSKTNTEAIYREAQTLRRLRHPNIVRCLIYHKFKNSIFIGILSSLFDLSWPRMTFRDRIRTKKNFKTWGWTGPGPRKFSKSRTRPDQDQNNFENLGPIRTGRSTDLVVGGSQLVTIRIWRVPKSLGILSWRIVRRFDRTASKSSEIF